MADLVTGALPSKVPTNVLQPEEKKPTKPRVPDDPQSVVAKTRVRRLAALTAASRRGRASTILSDTIG